MITPDQKILHMLLGGGRKASKPRKPRAPALRNGDKILVCGHTHATYLGKDGKRHLYRYTATGEEGWTTDRRTIRPA